MKSIKLFKSKIFAQALSFKKKPAELAHSEPVCSKNLTQQQQFLQDIRSLFPWYDYHDIESSISGALFWGLILLVARKQAFKILCTLTRANSAFEEMIWMALFNSHHFVLDSWGQKPTLRHEPYACIQVINLQFFGRAPGAWSGTKWNEHILGEFTFGPAVYSFTFLHQYFNALSKLPSQLASLP